MNANEFFEKYQPAAAPEPLGDDNVQLEWVGTAGFRVIYRGSLLLIDPFVTRPSLIRVGSMRMSVNKPLCAEVFPYAHNILIGHSHYDHLLDAPDIARNTGAVVHGSRSTETVCKAAGLPSSQINAVETGAPLEIGNYKITFIKSIHGKALAGRVPFPGEITGAPLMPMRATHYRHGDVYIILVEAGGFRFLHIGSADFIDSELEKIGHVDAVLVCLSGRQPRVDFLKTLDAILTPDYIIPHHYDDFFSPLENGFKIISGVDMDGFFNEFSACRRAAELLMPPPFYRFAFKTSINES